MKALVLIVSLLCASQSPLDALRKKIEGLGTHPLSSDKINAGLKEALKVSTGRAVISTGRPDGFLKNVAIKILLPEKMRTMATELRMLGMGSQMDQLEVGMNRAAEQAAPAAKQIFINAIVSMSIDDARKILSGSDTEATEYFKRQSTGQLSEAFTPIVHQAMDQVGVVRQYSKIMRNPVASSLAKSQNLNLDDYVVGQTLRGLFYVMAQEEKKIRTDPAAQTTALLREVFGRRLAGK